MRIKRNCISQKALRRAVYKHSMKRTSDYEYDRVRTHIQSFYPVPQAINPVDLIEIEKFKQEKLNTEDSAWLGEYIEYRYLTPEEDIRFDADIHTREARV